MNRIETGTTGERWVRCLIFIGLCTIFGGWFAYDGWVRYPAKNLQWALQQLPPRPPDAPPVTAAVNPNVTGKNIRVVLNKLENPGASVSRAELIDMLGDPAYADPQTGDAYFIGPAVFVHVKFANDQLRGPEGLIVKESEEPSERDIRSQKIWSIVLGIVVAIALIQFLRIIKTRVVLDDTGLNYSGNLIAWDAMTGLNADRYHDKGWVDLEYKDGEEDCSLRIDNYKVQAFKDIVNAICERKNFPNPLQEPVEPQAMPPEDSSTTM